MVDIVRKILGVKNQTSVEGCTLGPLKKVSEVFRNFRDHQTA